MIALAEGRIWVDRLSEGVRVRRCPLSEAARCPAKKVGDGRLDGGVVIRTVDKKAQERVHIMGRHVAAQLVLCFGIRYRHESELAAQQTRKYSHAVRGQDGRWCR